MSVSSTATSFPILLQSLDSILASIPHVFCFDNPYWRYTNMSMVICAWDSECHRFKLPWTWMYFHLPTLRVNLISHTTFVCCSNDRQLSVKFCYQLWYVGEECLFGDKNPEWQGSIFSPGCRVVAPVTWPRMLRHWRIPGVDITVCSLRCLIHFW